MNKKKLGLKIILFVFGLFFVLLLTGCGSKATEVDLILSAPNTQVNDDNGLDTNGINAYMLYSNGTVKKLARDYDYKLVFKEVEQINGVSGYKNVVRVHAEYFSKDKNIVSEPIYLVKNKNEAIVPKPLFNFTYHPVNALQAKSRVKGRPNNTNSFVFFTGHGQSYDLDSFNGVYKEKGFTVNMLYGKNLGSVKKYKLELTEKNIADNKKSLDEQLRVNQHITKAKTGDGVDKTLASPIYPNYYGAGGIKQGGFSKYRMTFTVKDSVKAYDGKNLVDVTLDADSENTFSHPVYSLSTGQRPLSKKAANWFDYILVIPIASIMWLFGFAGSLGLAVFFTTIVVRTIAWPIYAKTNNMSLKMQEAQPDIRKIQNKYKGRTDKQSQRAMQMEMMQVYRKHKIGFSSFLLMFLQMPIFIAMYQAVQRVYLPDGMFAAKFTRVTNVMGFIDFTQGRLKFLGRFNYVTFILAILVGVTMFLLQFFGGRKPKYMKTHDEQPTEQMKKQQRTTKIISFVMLIMMVIFSFQNNAIAFYWICGNLYSLAQTFIQGAINKKKYLKKHHKTGLEV